MKNKIIVITFVMGLVLGCCGIAAAAPETTLIVFQDDFQAYDVENPSDFSIDGVPTGNWTPSSTSANATRTFNSGNFGGTRLWISSVDGTSITSAGIDLSSNTLYTFSVMLVCETSGATREMETTYDLLVGQNIGSAVSILGGPVTVIAHGDDWSIPDSKEDHIFTQDFSTGTLTVGDQLFIEITRVTPIGSSSWFGVDDAVVEEKLTVGIDELDGVEVAEGTGSDTYDLYLLPDPNEAMPESERWPSAQVDVTITPDVELEVNGSTSPLVISFPAWTGDPNDYVSTITVTAFDDADIEGPHVGWITQTSSSSDTRWDAKNIQDVAVDVIDDDGEPDVVVSTEAIYVEEGGQDGEFTVVLATPPASGNVVNVAVSPADTQLDDPNDLVFDGTNWSIPQTVVVTAVDDGDVEGVHFSAMQFTVSGDPVYDGWAVDDVAVMIGDNELQGPTALLPYAWYRADAGVVSATGLAQDGENVIFIADSSGNLRHLDNPNNGGPVYVADAGNGKPALRFNDSETIWVSSADFGTLTQPNTIFLMVTWDEEYTAGDAGDNSMFFDGVSSAGRQALTAARQDLYEVYTGAGAVKVASTEGDRGNRLLHTVVYNGANTEHYINGALAQAGDGGSGPGLAGMVLGGRITLNENLEGEITEMILYPGALSQADREEIQEHLLLKWLGPIAVYEHNGFEVPTTEVSEPNSTDTYEVVVFGQPTADVDVTMSPADAQIDLGNGEGNPITLTFTGAGTQTVTVQAVDNTTSDGPRQVAVGHASTSSDTNYEAQTIRDVAVTVNDDEDWCGQPGTVYYGADLNMDCYVNVLDLVELATTWLGCTDPFYPEDCDL